MARVLALMAGVLSVVGAGGCSLLILDDMDFSDNSDKAQSVPTSTGTGDKQQPKDETLPSPQTPANEDGGTTEGGAPSGETCTSQTKNPTSAENVATGSGRPNWINVANVLSSGTDSASVTLPSGEESARLHVDTFKFTIPANARIRGVFVDVTKGPSGTAVQDSALNLEIDLATRRPTNSSMPWFNARTVVRYGPGKPLWDYPLTPAKINADAFGFNIVVKATAAATASVEAVSITVDYCVP